MLPVRQHFPDHSLGDVREEVLRELADGDFGSRVKAGARIAIGVGSRGIANIATITRAAVDYWKSQGCRPFIFPAMGSHGGATAEGQADVLAHFGIHEVTMECPIVSSLDVVSTGPTPEGIDTSSNEVGSMPVLQLLAVPQSPSPPTQLTVLALV